MYKKATSTSPPAPLSSPRWTRRLTGGVCTARDGAQNYGLWSNAEFDAALDAMDRETDEQQRIQLMRDAEQILETEVPQFTLAYENLTHAWRSYVKGHTIFWDIGFWDNLRLDTVWMDQ